MLRSKRKASQAITIHDGTLHKEILETIVTKAPFPDVELVLLSMRRKNPTQFEKHISLHEYICNNSCAIKIMQTTEDSQEAIRIEMSYDATISNKVIGIAKSLKTQTKGTLYIQCLQKHKTQNLQLAIFVLGHICYCPSKWRTTTIPGAEKSPR